MNYEDKIQKIVDGFSTWFEDDNLLELGRIKDDLKPHTALFESIYINKVKLKNRVIMGPMGNVNMADEMGKPSQKMISYYLERAKGGVGLITSGMIPVSVDDDPSYGDTDATGIFPRLDTHRSTYSGWRTISEGCHAYGAKFFVQLAPGMGRVGNPECLTKKMKLPISSSWQKNWYIPEIPCRPISDGKCKKIINKTAQAAADCKALNIDGVYLHGHSGYLIEQMTDTAYNNRKLGRYKYYQNFGIDMVKAIRKRVGPYYPIYYRIDLSLALQATYQERLSKEKVLKSLHKERSVQMTLDYMKNLVDAGVDMFDVDLGGYENWWLPHPPNGMPPGTFLEVAELVKDYFDTENILSNVGIKVPIVGVGKLGNPDLAELALRSQKCDLVMLSRPLLADPDWVNKVYAERVKEIKPCIGDHEGCLGQLAIGGHPHCAVNPRTAFEDVYSEELPPIDQPKKIAVVGAGPCGVTAAVTLKRRGHDVTLIDNKEKAGGMLLTGGIPKVKYEILNYVDYLNHQLKHHNVKVLFETIADETMLKSVGYDIIITSTGTKPIIPPIEGVQKKHVITAIDFLDNKDKYSNYSDYVVVGGSDVGCEIAHLLSYEFKKKTTLIEMGPYLMPKTCTSNRHFMIHHLNKAGVKILNCTQLKSIEDKQIVLSRNYSKTVPDPTQTWTPLLSENIVNPFKKMIKEDLKDEKQVADLVILATGASADEMLYERLKKYKTAKSIYNIGDSFEPGRVLEAVKAGYKVGRTL